jgi:HAE1 family hydrophobic/amphiphilic exporter-1
MFLPEFSVNKSITSLMIILVIVVLGMAAVTRLPVDLFPDITFPMITIYTMHEGVGPEEIENSVTRLIEASVNRVEGIKNIYSISQRGASLVFAEFDWGKDMNLAAQNVREKIDELGTGMFGLPEETKRPIIYKYDLAEMPLMFFSVAGKDRDIHEVKDLVDDYMKGPLEAVEGVGFVQVFSGAPREILVSLEREKLNAYNISLSKVVQRLKEENIDSSSGHLKEDYRDYLVRVRGKFEEVEELKKLVLARREGSSIYLGDIAKVFDTYGEQRVYPRANREPSVMVGVMKQSGENTVQVSRRAWKKIQDIKKRLPPDIFIVSGFDQAEYINRAIGRVGANVLWGGILALIILFLFLRHPRPTIIISLAIPISLLAAFIPMHFMGTTLNMMSLGGLALAIGMLLDNSIVVLENIFRRMEEEKEHRLKAAKEGASEVGGPIVASTLTTIAVFVPILFISGIAARLFRELALTITFSLLASLIVALTLVPMMASKILNVKFYSREKTGALFGLRERYKNFLSLVLKRKGLTILSAFILLILSGLLIIPLGKEFMPRPEDRMFIIQLSLPQGTRLEETNKLARQMEEIIHTFPELETEQAVVGIDQGGSSQENLAPEAAFFIVKLVDRKKRKRSTSEIIDLLRDKLSVFPQIEKIDFGNIGTFAMGGYGQKPVEVKIFGRDLPTLANLSKEVAKKMSEIEELKDIEEKLVYGSPEIQIRLDREKSAHFGLEMSRVARNLEAAIEGKVATRFESKGEEIDVRVRLREEDRASLEDIEKIPLFTSRGTRLHLGDVARIYKSRGPGEITRENQERKAAILANIVSKKDVGRVMGKVQEKLKKVALPSGYFIEYGGEWKKMRETFRDLGIAFLLGALLVYMIMAAKFESLVHPLAIMFAIPFSLIGVIWALFLGGANLSANALIGVIVLAGIVVNNGIVLVDYTNKLRERGLSKEEAIIKAGAVRLRPVLMTALTTIGGVSPMIFMGGSGAEMRRPLALAIFGGLLFGTILTLVIVPTIYSILDGLAQKVRAGVRKRLHGE